MKIFDPGDALRGKRKERGRRGRGGEEGDENGGEGIEARLILKLVCKHGRWKPSMFRCDVESHLTPTPFPPGILKTHSLHLTSSKFLVAVVDPDTTQSSFTLSSKTLREWSDHFSFSSGANTTSIPANGTTNPINKNESELGWLFDEDEIRVKTFEGGGGGKKTLMATEVKCGVEDFEEYFVHNPPVALAFPIKEYKVGQRKRH